MSTWVARLQVKRCLGFGTCGALIEVHPWRGGVFYDKLVVVWLAAAKLVDVDRGRADGLQRPTVRVDL